MVSINVLQAQVTPVNLAYPADIAQWDEAVKVEQRTAGEKMIADLKSAVAAKVSRFVIEHGNYRFSQQFLKNTISIENAQNLEIVANDVTFWIEKPNITPFRISNARNLKITGLTVDYDPLPFTQGTIKKVIKEEECLEVEIDRGFPSPLSPFIYAATTTASSRVYIYDTLGNMRENIRDDYVKEFTETNDGTFKVKFKGGYNFQEQLSRYNPYKVGDKIVMPVGGGSLFEIQYSEGVTFYQCNIYSAGGMSFSATYGKGGACFR